MRYWTSHWHDISILWKQWRVKRLVLSLKRGHCHQTPEIKSLCHSLSHGQRFLKNAPMDIFLKTVNLLFQIFRVASHHGKSRRFAISWLLRTRFHQYFLWEKWADSKTNLLRTPKLSGGRGLTLSRPPDSFSAISPQNVDWQKRKTQRLFSHDTCLVIFLIVEEVGLSLQSKELIVFITVENGSS